MWLAEHSGFEPETCSFSRPPENTAEFRSGNMLRYLKYMNIFTDRLPGNRRLFAYLPRRDSLSCLPLIFIISEQNKNDWCDSVFHVPNGCTFHSPSSAVGFPCAAGRRNPVRGLSRIRGRGGRDRVRPGAAWPRGGACALDSGPTGAAGKGAALSGRSWSAKTPDGDATFPAGRCDDRGRGGVALPGVGCGHRGNPGQPDGGELYGDEAAGLAERGLCRALLADPAGGECRSERGARSLEDCHASLGLQSRRSACARGSMLAGRAVPIARRAAGNMAGAP
jgi:hypothetical protein